MRNDERESAAKGLGRQSLQSKVCVSFAVFAGSLGELLRRIYTIRNVSRIKGNGRKKHTEIE